jgi:solute carrier family 25 oxoglutarate transporter 11
MGSAYLRQSIVAPTVLGLFYTIQDAVQGKLNRIMSVQERMAASVFVGGLSAFLANPFDLALVRFQAEGTLRSGERRNYSNCIDAVIQITKQEGFTHLWKGATPTVLKTMMIALGSFPPYRVGVLAPYEECKQRLKRLWGDRKGVYVVSSLVAGTFGSLLGLPFDNIKTKVQKMKPDAEGRMPYRSLQHCLVKTIRDEGFLRLWIGLPIFIVRIGGHSAIGLLVLDGLKYLILGNK